MPDDDRSTVEQALATFLDAFSNLDEFAKRADGAAELFQVMGRFYLIRMTQFYDRLSGVICMMAAIFTVTWMQKNNELLAMLAAGISTLVTSSRPRAPSERAATRYRAATSRTAW